MALRLGEQHTGARSCAADGKKAAETQGKSLAQTAREALAEKFKPSKEEIWAAADRLRQKIGKVSGDSTADIREWRDNNEPYR
jgi:hypothetical protein